MVTAQSAVSRTRRTVAWSVVIVVFVMLFTDLFAIVLIDWVRNLPRKSFAMATQPPWIQRWAFAASEGFMLGLFGTQLLMSAAYAALGDGKSSKRVLVTTFVFALFSNVLVVFGTSWFQIPWGDLVIVFLIATLFFFAFQIPMWGVRSGLGWVIKSPWSSLPPGRPLRFSLAHLLGWSTFLAVPLCIISSLNLTSSRGEHVPIFLWIWGLILCGQFLWFAYLVLVTDLTKLWFGVAVALSVLVVIAMQCGFFWWLERSSRSGPSYCAIVFGNICGDTILLSCLWLARRLGFRLLPFDANRLAKRAVSEGITPLNPAPR